MDLDLQAIIDRLEEANEVLFQQMFDDPHSGVLDFPFAIIGEVIEELKGASDDEAGEND